MNDSNVTRDGEGGFGNTFVPPAERYSVTSERTWVTCTCIVQTQVKLLRNVL